LSSLAAAVRQPEKTKICVNLRIKKYRRRDLPRSGKKRRQNLRQSADKKTSAAASADRQGIYG
jgi:hypothetical protein